MSRKRPIPGVDEAALATLAGQFPSGSLRPAAVPTQDNAPLAPGNKELLGLEAVSSAASGALRRNAPGRGLAVSALMLAFLAVLIAVSAVMPPPARSWLTQTLGDSEIVNLVTGSRADIDDRLAAAAQSIATLESNAADGAARLEAVETVVGSGSATRRLDAVEAGLRQANQRLAAAAGDADRMAASRADALDARLATFDGDLKTVQDKLAATERDLNDILTARLGAVEADIGVLQKVDHRPEKFFLAALQLRDLTRTGNPFTREVVAAQAMAGQNADLLTTLKGLAADADQGVATVAELRDNFTAVLVPRLAAVAAANRPPITAQAWGWVQSLFTTTASAGAAVDRNAAVIALAARSLDQGQLEAAVHQLVLLEDEAALVAAEWLKNASVRLATDKAIATVMSQALEQLAASN